MDYSNTSLEFDIYFKHYETSEKVSELFNIIESVILETDNIEYILEEAAIDNKKKGNNFSKIIQFLKEIFKKFLNKTEYLSSTFDKWLKSKESDLKKVDFEEVEVSIFPYWVSDQAVQTSKILEKTSNLKTKEDIDNYISTFDDENGEWVEGLKNFLRSGNTKQVKKVHLKGSQLKSKVFNEFIPFCKSYKSFSNGIKRHIDKIEADIKTLTKLIEEKKDVKESINPNYFTILEKAETEDKKVEVKKSGNLDTSSLENKSKNELETMKKLVQIEKTVFTVGLTIIEERFVAYFTALRQLV